MAGKRKQDDTEEPIDDRKFDFKEFEKEILDKLDS